MDNGCKRATNSEQSGIFRMRAALSILREDSLERRISGLKYGKRDLGMVRSGLERIFEGVMKTLPADQRTRVNINMRNMHYNVGIQKAADHYDEENGRWISYAACEQIITGLKDHCIMCNKTHAQQRQCKLRKALDEMPINYREDDEHSGCRFFTMWSEF